MLRRIWHYPLTRWQVRLAFLVFLIAEYFVFGMNLLPPIISSVALLVIGGGPLLIQRLRSRRSST
ncbi:MAG: hypothetical protein ABI841_07765 [Chloroflexota bacterium]